MASLKDRIASDLKEAMKARDQMRLDTLRSALSGFTYKRSETGQDLTENDELEVVRRLVKQRGDSLAEFEKAGRAELAAKERAEREILLAYLPQQKSEIEVREIVQSVLAELPSDARNQGAVMKVVMPQLKGLADGNLVRKVVEQELGGR
ncbi:MAG: GatB/YqeY domain-containing protein [Candidatus Eremiobacteraeota bacterium]|nr:GatB/YqeY domain-containing protein [Candidatus Eremiobacteraeota bacterium]MBV8284918.1 GatB/YqeY domain-containing protein [Candidatus Eremiobacteraeota bacterium]MBV8432681.1 GatB/YqeY domain-containing protein [Candidatus Eremiobacteraeota bacterium]MBV8723570.1 GatB/YqeY domain-containing protein [Candidatus Eremiobacteraeota bacterium]